MNFSDLKRFNDTRSLGIQVDGCSSDQECFFITMTIAFFPMATRADVDRKVLAVYVPRILQSKYSSVSGTCLLMSLLYLRNFKTESHVVKQRG